MEQKELQITYHKWQHIYSYICVPFVPLFIILKMKVYYVYIVGICGLK